MRLIRIVAYSLILAGCQTMPEKPVVEVGSIDYGADQIIVGLSDGSDPVRRESLSFYDKATCFKPEPWERWKVYVQLLEQYAATCQKPAGVK